MISVTWRTNCRSDTSVRPWNLIEAFVWLFLLKSVTFYYDSSSIVWFSAFQMVQKMQVRPQIICLQQHELTLTVTNCDR